jgi:SMODS-associating 2TM, beta-strand rich effector domain
LHSYSTNSKGKASSFAWLFAFSVLLAWILGVLIKFFKIDIPWWLDMPSVVGFYALLFKIFDQHLWKRKILGKKMSDIPNLQGTWVGMVNSSYNGGTITPNIVIHIHQTWTETIIKTDSGNSTSYSVMAAINTLQSEYVLQHVYKNEPSGLSTNSMNSHLGSVHLSLSPDERELKGIYFTGRGRETHGDMKFTRVSFDQLSIDEAIRRQSP